VILAFLLGFAGPGVAQDLPPGGTFVDDDNNLHEGMIEAIVELGITFGCDTEGPRYCPDQAVNRGQMASFLTRAFALPAGPERFADDNGSVHEPAINAVAAAGITFGCDPVAVDDFCPESDVTRAQMAAFLQRALGLEVPPTTDTFSDDDASSLQPEIEAIAAAGITSGCSSTEPHRFCPFDPVRRDQMATFLGRAVGAFPNTPPQRITANERMLADVDNLVAFGPRVAGTSAEADAAAWLAAELVGIAGNAVATPVPLPNGATSRNVSATFGTGVPDVVIGAHYDSVQGSIGADDNASGVAVVLEVARRLASAPPDATVMLVAFGAEEVVPGFSADDHHYGSRQLASELQTAGSLPRFMISVDMVGVGSDLWAVTYLGQLPEAAELLVSAGSDVGVDIAQMARGDISDHEAFTRAGVPAAFLWRPDNPAWHTPDDTAVRSGALADDLAVVSRWLELVLDRIRPPGGAD
jgi:hypothetical protein